MVLEDSQNNLVVQLQKCLGDFDVDSDQKKLLSFFAIDVRLYSPAKIFLVSNYVSVF